MRLPALLCLVQGTVPAAGKYSKNRSFVGKDFFDRWVFDSTPDPTSGHVVYVDAATAMSEGFVNATDSRVYMGADLVTKTGGTGRRSVRVRSKAAFDGGLFIVSVDHVPTGCSTWPAFWMYGEDAQHPWPTWGEYDVIEGVHRQDRVTTTLHTAGGCDQSGVEPGEDMSGAWVAGSWKERSNDCYIHAPGQYENQGCIQEGPTMSIGPEFNARGGGTYAAEWAPHGGHMRTWFWPSGEEPSDLAEGAPEPDSWGTPYSLFRLGAACTQDHFARMRLLFDLSFCGDWAGGTFPGACPELAARMTCEELVADHPEELQDAYWSVRVLDVYSWHPAPGGEREEGAGLGHQEGSRISWWHWVISTLIAMQSVVLCGIGWFVFRHFRSKDPRQEDAEKAVGRSPPSSPSRPLVLAPASPTSPGSHPNQQAPARIHPRPDAGQSRSVAMSRAFSAPNRLGPAIRLGPAA